MLRVGYDATAAVRQRAGIGRYSRELLRALVTESGDIDLRIVYTAVKAAEPIDLPDAVRLYQIPVPDRFTNVVWQRLRLPIPIEARTGALDVFHSPDFSLPPSRANSIVTIHDLAFEVLPQVTVPTLARYLHHAVPYSISMAAAVIVPSAHTKDALQREFNTPPEKVHVIPEGLTDDFQAESDGTDSVVRTLRHLDRPYLLTVSTLEPRKNLERLMRAFSSSTGTDQSIELIIVGRRGWMYEGIFNTRNSLPAHKNIRILTDVDDWELPALYRQSLVTVYPSLYEGFGLPVLEAMGCGAPLAVSGNSSLPEVAGPFAAYFDPWDVEDMAHTIEAIVNDECRRRQWKAAGPAHARQMTWTKAAQATLNLYGHVAHG